jgi:hypothetical protein
MIAQQFKQESLLTLIEFIGFVAFGGNLPGPIASSSSTAWHNSSKQEFSPKSFSTEVMATPSVFNWCKTRSASPLISG